VFFVELPDLIHAIGSVREFLSESGCLVTQQTKNTNFSGHAIRFPVDLGKLRDLVLKTIHQYPNWAMRKNLHACIEMVRKTKAEAQRLRFEIGTSPSQDVIQIPASSNPSGTPSQ
jgi:hypothetical protein